MTTITTLPDAPSRTDPATFSTKSDALLGALATFVSETNAVAGECVTNAATATTKAGEAVISAAAAAASAATANTKAGEASVSASSASGSAGTANTKAGEASASAIAAAASAVTANTKAGEAAASAASIAGGPVASVNGRTGVVTGVQDSLVSGTSIKTINSTSLLGSGDIAITGNATHTGDATGDTALTVVKINGTLMSGLATGILKNTTGTGVPSIATVRTDYAEPTTALATGLLKNTTTTGAHTIATAETDYVTPTGSGTLTNKTIALGSNTVSGTIAQFNAAVTDADFATGGGTATGTNTGDNAPNTMYSSLVSNATHTGDATGSTVLTVVKINGTLMSGLATGLLKNTTGTGVPSIATVRTDYAEATAALATGLLKNTTSTGAHSIAVAGTDYVAPSGALGTPSSGTLTNCTADGTNAVGFKTIPQNSKSADYTLVLADSGYHIYHPSADTTARTYTIPANSSVSYPIGTTITFVNDTSAGVVTIAITTDTMVLAGTGSTGSRTLAASGVATAIKTTATRWMISGTGLT